MTSEHVLFHYGLHHLIVFVLVEFIGDAGNLIVYQQKCEAVALRVRGKVRIFDSKVAEMQSRAGQAGCIGFTNGRIELFKMLKLGFIASIVAIASAFDCPRLGP